MPIPTALEFSLPLLRLMGDGRECRVLVEAPKVLADEFGLTDAERAQEVASGGEIYVNRIAWARTYLKKAGLIESTRRGFYRITERGRDLLRTNPSAITPLELKRYPEFVAFMRRERPSDDSVGGEAAQELPTVPEESPQEVFQKGYESLRRQLADDLLEILRSCDPAFFERLVVEVLVKMGYGGTREDAGRAVGRSGDGGIDGIIKEDRLGLDAIYIQAKRWNSGTVGRPDVQQFAGALQGNRAKKGVFITTSTFTKEARAFAAGIDSKIVLIDGPALAELMIDYGVGVSTVATYEIKRIDGDYFA